MKEFYSKFSTVMSYQRFILQVATATLWSRRELCQVLVLRLKFCLTDVTFTSIYVVFLRSFGGTAVRSLTFSERRRNVEIGNVIRLLAEEVVLIRHLAIQLRGHNLYPTGTELQHAQFRDYFVANHSC